MVIHEDIERELERQAGIYAIAESEGDEITLSGLVHSEADRRKACQIASTLAGGKRIIDNLEIATILPEKIGDMSVV